MKNLLSLAALVTILMFSCKPNPENGGSSTANFNWNPDNFSDKKIVRYKVNGFDKLSLDQKKLVYYLTQAGMSGRDIIYDQLYRHNLTVRRALEKVLNDYKGERSGDAWDAFVVYAKDVFFANGIHHHYSSDKFEPGFSREYFESLLKDVGHTLSLEAMEAMFNPALDNKRTNVNPEKGLVKGSAVNFYDPDITEAEVDAFYDKIIDPNDATPVEHGLNSKLVRNADGSISEKVYRVGGMYGASIEKIVFWLEKAVGVAENEAQGNALKLLIGYYKTGNLKKWDEYNVAWCQAIEGDIDYINGFIEVYQDPKGKRGSYETIVQIKDFDASARMEKVAAEAQWFEDNMPFMPEHKRKEAKGVSYKVVTVAGEAGDASPSTPIGVNLPNNNWIRSNHGSKSVSLGNIIEGYSNADGPGLLKEFALNDEEIARAKKHGKLSGKIHTALHEVIGHASGQLEPGVGQPGATLKNYASPLEEARADLVSLYFITHPKMVELGLMENLDVGKAQYENYLKNGLMLQLRRIKPGNNIEQAHMRNRQSISKWVYEKGQEENIVELIKRDGNTFVQINDYEKLRGLFGELLKEVQRMKSQGDYEACKAFIEGYGVQVDKTIHEEVLARSKKLNIPPYGGFINPVLKPKTDGDGNITDVEVTYPDNFLQQHLDYGKQYSFLPDYN